MLKSHLHNGRFPLLLLATLLLAALWLTTSALQAQDPILPAAPPNAAAGLEIFADRCANCHGPAGQGDGELAARLPLPPADFTDPDFRRTRVPATMFNAITNGILEGGMPPFGPLNTESPISEANRWNLVAATYSLATPAEALTLGEIVYQESCAACHGLDGQGEGPDAAGQDPAPTDLTSLSYWYNRNNETVFTALQSGAVPAHEYDLNEEALWAVVDYSRTFSYNYISQTALAGPIAAATISGVLSNGGTGELIADGEVLLRAFDANFQPVLTLTETVGTDGFYAFSLTDVMPDWVYLVSTTYNGLGFSSDAGRLNQAASELSMPITVFDTTTDPAVVNVDQIHILLNFAGNTVQVDELYIFSNRDRYVFIGEAGDPDAGTVEIALPAGATNVTFQRTLGRLDSAIPAPEVIPTANGWADTIPLHPGQSGLNLIVSYDLPYDGGAALDRPVHYSITNVGVIMTAGGVSLSGEGFVDQGVQQMGDSQFIAYTRTGVPAQSTLSLALQGRPDFSFATTGAMAVAQPDNATLDWLVGGLALLVVGITAVFTIRTWRAQSTQAEADHEDEAQLLRERLIQAIADLDTAFEQGNLDEATYGRQRAALTADLAAIWGE